MFPSKRPLATRHPEKKVEGRGGAVGHARKRDDLGIIYFKSKAGKTFREGCENQESVKGITRNRLTLPSAAAAVPPHGATGNPLLGNAAAPFFRQGRCSKVVSRKMREKEESRTELLSVLNPIHNLQRQHGNARFRRPAASSGSKGPLAPSTAARFSSAFSPRRQDESNKENIPPSDLSPSLRRRDTLVNSAKIHHERLVRRDPDLQFLKSTARRIVQMYDQTHPTSPPGSEPMRVNSAGSNNPEELPENDFMMDFEGTVGREDGGNPVGFGYFPPPPEEQEQQSVSSPSKTPDTAGVPQQEQQQMPFPSSHPASDSANRQNPASGFNFCPAFESVAAKNVEFPVADASPSAFPVITNEEVAPFSSLHRKDSFITYRQSREEDSQPEWASLF